jgi:imidazolonepropionase-like amidohydrolase
MTVEIAGDRIAAIEKTGDNPIPRDARIVDAAGKFLVPGLWDMHVHWYDERYLPLFTANGVTGVRQMWGMPMHYAWRMKQRNGSLVGPRQSIASTIVDGPKPFWPRSLAVHNETEARAAVADAKDAGADFVKVYGFLTRDAYFAIADESKKRGIPFAGHVPYAIRASEASDAGQKSIEHLTGIQLEASSREAELRQALNQAAAAPEPTSAVLALASRQARSLLETFDAKKAGDLFMRLAKNHTWQCPTLTVLHAMAFLDDRDFTSDPRLKYMPPGIRTQWDPQRDFRLKNRTADDWAIRKQLYQQQLQIIAPMRRAGVEFLAGTDALNPFCFPGFSLHDELALLVSAGLTPMEALQAATRNPARYLGTIGASGTIEKGKTADLVILDADPLADIHNTTRIAGVIAGGRYFAKPALDEMLAGLEALGRASR